MHYGPIPYWSEADPDALVGTDRHTVYAVNSKERGYILGVLRSFDDDSPLLICKVPLSNFLDGPMNSHSTVDSGTPQTIFQAVSVDLGRDKIQSITLYSNPLLDAKTIVWNYDKPLRSEESTFPTAFIITLGERMS